MGKIGEWYRQLDPVSSQRAISCRLERGCALFLDPIILDNQSPTFPKKRRLLGGNFRASKTKSIIWTLSVGIRPGHRMEIV